MPEYRELLIKLIGTLDDETVKSVFKDQLLAKSLASDNNPTAGLQGNRLKAEEIVRDLMTEGELHKVPSREEIDCGPDQEASGGGAPKMVREYSNFAAQSQALTSEYNKLAGEVGALGSSVKALMEGQAALTKALTALVAKKAEDEEEDEEEEAATVTINQGEEDDEEEGKKSRKAANPLAAETAAGILAKAEEEEEEGDEEEEEEEEESGKSLAAASKAKISKALFEGVQMVFAKSESIKEADHRRRVQKAAAETLRKALRLAKAAVEEGDKDLAKAVKSHVEAIEEFMFIRDIPLTSKKAKKGKKEAGENQTKWPNEVGKAVGDELVKLQDTVHGLMDRIARMGKGGAGLEPAPSMEISKAMGTPNFFVEKERKFNEDLETGMISDRTYGSAMELLGLMQQVHKGMLPEAVVKSGYRTAPSEVRMLFPEFKGVEA